MVNRLYYFIGYFGELLILLYSKLKCCYVIQHRCKFGEVDLIVSKKKELIFIKVEVGLLKRQSIVNSFKYFLSNDLSFLGYSIGMIYVSLFEE
ncbi:hypothetical protein GOY07_01195 [Wolbachia endosymbiont of Litomosoides sigmodontis]|uniref:hypothetical protein n=1 Tax=Wolbachia endosymbiont of Litomosoides sigmodontis TaxID=80850 RepID=UPI0015889743|nr:hypothetical protein [Wolbachia endosymbiont of Litomosoides sigmodontis]QKX02841.1 hypothetical protein GOY07_01195 [Wolbachia endosymbiont of Litomosoides sigmodontis]